MSPELLWCFGKSLEVKQGPAEVGAGCWQGGSCVVPGTLLLLALLLLLPGLARLAVYLAGEAQSDEHSLFQLRIQNVFIVVLLVCVVLQLSREGLLRDLDTSLPSTCLLNDIFSVLTQVVGFSLFLLINVCRSYNLLCVISSHTDVLC